MIALGDQLRADHDVDRARFHCADELRGTERRPDGVGSHDGRPRFGEQFGDLVGDPLDARAAGDEAVLLAAFRAGLGRRHDVPAMVAGEAVHQPVLDHPRGAVGALEAVPAVAAQGQRREAAAVEEKQRLLFALEVGADLLDQLRREPAATRRRVLGKVDRSDLGKRRAGEALAKRDFAVAAELDHVPALDRRRRGRQDDRDVLELPAHDRAVAGVVLDAVFLLEAWLVRLVDDDQAEVRVGEEQRGARADRDRRFAAGDPAPGAAALGRAQVRVPSHRRAAEASLEALQERLGQRDFRQEHERLLPLPEAFRDRLEIDLGLARAGDFVEQDGVEALADR